MKSPTKKQHWENIYQVRDTIREVSWYQDNPKTSIELILSRDIDKRGAIIDIGGGDSKLVDKLLELNFKNVFVLDISTKALEKAKIRLKEKASSVNWVESDILEFDTETRFDVWHDRATFHFFTEQEDIARYVDTAGKLIKPNSYLVISTFSMSGPKKCSGLDVSRYSEGSIKKTFKKRFSHIKSFEKVHTTPFNTKQSFLWSVFTRVN